MVDLDYFKNIKFRKCSDVNQKYPFFELIDEEGILLYISADNKGIIDVYFDNSIVNKKFKFNELILHLEKGKELLDNEIKSVDKHEDFIEKNYY